jgi:hypothetical protein
MYDFITNSQRPVTNNEGRKTKETYRVFWIGEDGASLFTKDFNDYKLASEFSSPLKESIIAKLNKVNKFGQKYEIAQTPLSKEMLKGLAMRRHVIKKASKGKKETSNADGVSNGIAEVTVSTTSEYQKSQKIRLFDVFVIAPILIYGATRKEIPTWLRVSLGFIGVATAYYNAKNYLVNRAIDKKVSDGSGAN